jgi:hypothetical protein
MSGALACITALLAIVLWTLLYGHHEDRSPTHGFEATREAAIAAFAKSWLRESYPE